MQIYEKNEEQVSKIDKISQMVSSRYGLKTQACLMSKAHAINYCTILPPGCSSTQDDSDPPVFCRISHF